jgi:hypothetical protein
MTKKTTFQPDVHGFAFVNSWTFEDPENDQMVNAVLGGVNGAVESMLKPFASLGGTAVASSLKGWVDNVVPSQYGLCGGMAFAALDYYKKGTQVPRGAGYDDVPRRDSRDGRILRDFLWRRQLESMSVNVPTLLVWMGMLHSIIPMVGGAGWLLEQTRQHWATLKKHIDNGEPWPICLVGTSTSPFHNHQVLAYGYSDPGDGTGTVYVYDMNCPDKENTIHLDFRGIELMADESCASADRGALRGFFCEVYMPASPPTVTHSEQQSEEKEADG